MSNTSAVKNKLVFQIVDSPRRDLEWRLFLSFLLSKRGITSVIGNPHDIELYSSFSSNALLLGRFGGNTGRSKFDLRLVELLKEKDIDVFFLHDEGAFYFEAEYDSAVRRVYPEEYFGESFFKRVYFWGSRQADCYKSNPNQEKMSVLGCPRFDLLKSKYKFIDNEEVNQISDENGKFVLICSRFAGLSPAAGDVSLVSTRLLEIRREGLGKLKKSDAELMAVMLKVWKNVAIDHAMFIDAVFSLCIAYPSVTFLFRPHPSEDVTLYSNVFRTLPNVKIDKGGDLRPVLRATSLMIHSESSSGIEAEIAGTPSINFVTSLIADKMNIAGTKLVGERVSSYEELVVAFDNLYTVESSSDDVASSNNTEIKNYVVNFDESYDSIGQLVSDVDNFFENKSSSSMTTYKKLYFLNITVARYWARRIFYLIRSILSGFKMVRNSKSVKINTQTITKLWRKFDADESQLTVTSGVIIVSPKK